MVAGREATPSDVESTERLMRYWSEGAGGQKIRWGVAGDFDRCRVLLGKYVSSEQLDGLCSNLHQRATGARPGHAPSEQGGSSARKGR
jgi:hypothetical protein